MRGLRRFLALYIETPEGLGGLLSVCRIKLDEPRRSSTSFEVYGIGTPNVVAQDFFGNLKAQCWDSLRS